MAAIPLIPSSAPHLSQGLASAQSAEGSAYRFRAEFRHAPSMSHCYRRMLFSEMTRDPSASPSPWPLPTIYFDKPHRWWYRKERRRKFLSFKHPPSIPNQLYILGAVRPSAPQEYRSTLGCKSVGGCPVPPFPSHSFSLFVQNAATALSCNGALSIFPRLTYRFAECEKIQTRRPFLTAPQRRDSFYAPVSHTPTTV